MELEDNLTPEGNEAMDQCPICGRFNNPGAVDICNHYCAARWDGSIMWSDPYESFSNEYHRFIEIREALEEVYPGIGHSFIEEFVRTEKLSKELSQVSSWWEDSPDIIFEEVIDFEYGLSSESDGMLSGSGHFLYHEKPELMDRVRESLHILNQKLLERISEQREADSQSQKA